MDAQWSRRDYTRCWISWDAPVHYVSFWICLCSDFLLGEFWFISNACAFLLDLHWNPARVSLSCIVLTDEVRWAGILSKKMRRQLPNGQITTFMSSSHKGKFLFSATTTFNLEYSNTLKGWLLICDFGLYLITTSTSPVSYTNRRGFPPPTDSGFHLTTTNWHHPAELLRNKRYHLVKNCMATPK